MRGAVYVLEKTSGGYFKVIDKLLGEFNNEEELKELSIDKSKDVFARNGALGKIEPVKDFFMSGTVEINNEKFKTKKVATYRVKINRSSLTKDAEFFVESVVLLNKDGKE